MEARPVLAVVCAVAAVGVVGSLAAMPAAADPPVPHRWTFQVVARTGPAGSPTRIGFPPGVQLQEHILAIDHDGSVVTRYQAPGGPVGFSGLFVYDALTGETRAFAERPGFFSIQSGAGLDFRGGLIAFATEAGPVEIWSKQGQFLRTIEPAGPEFVLQPTHPRVADGSAAYRALRSGGDAVQLIIEGPATSGGRSQLRIADTLPNSSYSAIAWPAISDDLRFAAKVTLRATGETQLRRWRGDPLPLQPVVVARSAAGAFQEIFEPLALNRAGQVAFWADPPGPAGPQLYRAADQSDQTLLAPVGPLGPPGDFSQLGAFAPSFAPSITAAGLVAFGLGETSIGHNGIWVSDGTDRARVAASSEPLRTQLGDFFVRFNPSFPGRPVINDQRRIAFFAILDDFSTALVIASPFACPPDFNHDEFLDPDDLASYIACYFALPPCPEADHNQDGRTDPDDLSDYIAQYFAGC